MGNSNLKLGSGRRGEEEREARCIGRLSKPDDERHQGGEPEGNKRREIKPRSRTGDFVRSGDPKPRGGYNGRKETDLGGEEKP